MKKFSTILISFFVLIFLSSCKKDIVEHKENVLSVRVQSVSLLSKSANQEKFLARVSSYQEIDVTSEISAKVINVNKHFGDFVKKGDVLAYLGDNQNTNAIDIQKQQTANNLLNLQNTFSSTSDLYGSTIKSLNDNLLDSLDTLYSTKLSLASTVSIYENKVQDAENAYNKAKSDKEIFNSTKDIELDNLNLSLTQAQKDLNLAENNLLDTQVLLDNSEQKINEDAMNTLNSVYGIMIVAQSYARGVFGITDITPENKDFYRLFGISNDNLLANTEDRLKALDHKIDDLDDQFNQFKEGETDIETIISQFSDLLDYERSYVEDLYLLASKYTIAMGDFSQNDLDAFIKELNGLLNDIDNSVSSLQDTTKQLSDFQVNKNSSLDQAQNRVDLANTNYEKQKNSYDILLQNQKQQLLSLDYAVNFAEINLNDAQSTLDKIKIDNDIQIKNIENQIDDLKNQIAIQYSKQNIDYSGIDSQIDQAKSELDLINNQLMAKTIISDIDGFIFEENLKEGNIVNVGENLFKIGSVGTYTASFEIDSDMVDSVKKGDKANIYCDSCRQKNYSGEVLKISKSLESISSKVKVEVVFNVGQGDIKSNNLVEVYLNITEDPSIYISLKNLKVDSGNYSVFLYEDGFAKERFIKIGQIDGDTVEVLDGLANGDVLISSASNYLNDGDKVQIEKVKR